AAPACEAAPASGGRLARAGVARLLPGSGGAGGDANRAHRAADAAHRRPDVSDVAPELGLGLQTDKRPGDSVALARLAEDAGFAVVTTFNDLWFQPALPALLEIAAATTRVRVGPSCLNPFTVHPVEIAGQIAALDAASDGRAFLGLARGAWIETLGVDRSRRVIAIAEAWDV